MSPEFLIILVAFAFPGAVAVEAWDWACHREGRSVPSVLGHGIIVSTLVYGLLQGAGFIDLGRLANAAGTLSFTLIVLPKNVAFFGATCMVMAFLGFLVGKLSSSFLDDLAKKSPVPLAWSHIVEKVTKGDADLEGAWMYVRTKSGLGWHGRPFRIPVTFAASDVLSLWQVRSIDPVTNVSIEQTLPILLIPMSDIEFIQVDYKGAIKDANTSNSSDSTSSGHRRLDGQLSADPNDHTPQSAEPSAPARPEEVTEPVLESPAPKAPETVRVPASP